MDYFERTNDILHCEEISLADIADTYGTPTYVYSGKTIVEHIDKLNKAFSGIDHQLCYSVKALSNIAIIGLLASRGAGADVISGGEVFRALRSGVKPEKIIFAGPGKTEEEIEYALKENVFMLNVESEAELELIDRVAGRVGKKARIALRINPDVDPVTHEYIAVGLKTSKFGIPWKRAVEVYRDAVQKKNLIVEGIHQHIGSQIIHTAPYEESLEKIVYLIEQLKKADIEIKYLDIGGGFGIPYESEKVPLAEDYAKGIIPIVSETGCKLFLETGRMIVGNAGLLLTEVLFEKHGEDRSFLIVDAAMNDLVRPSLYGSYHDVVPVVDRKAVKVKRDIVGPICESGDFIARNREVPAVQSGDFLAIKSAGAYSFVMSSNYNSRGRAAEVLVWESNHFLIRRRETYEDLVQNEYLPGFIKARIESENKNGEKQDE